MEEISKLLEISHRIEKGEKTEITVLGKKFMIGDLKRNIVNRINDIQFKTKYFKGSEDPKGLRKRMKYVNSADARISSLILLNSLANIPFLHAVHWRILNKRYTTETFSAIMETGLDNKEYAFFLKNSAVCQNLLSARMMMIKS